MKNKKLIYIAIGVVILVIVYFKFFRKKSTNGLTDGTNGTGITNLTSDIDTDTTDLTGSGSTSGTTDNPTNDPVLTCSDEEVTRCKRMKSRIAYLESQPFLTPEQEMQLNLLKIEVKKLELKGCC